jgi:hypothetical protein
MVLVQLECGSTRALGYTYADHATAVLAGKLLNEFVIASDAFCHPATLQKLLAAIRNLGETGMAMMAVSAIDNALWDLRARLVNLPLVSLLGQVRSSIRVYGSGGFTTYSDKQLAKQLGGWSEQGFSMVKIKIGSEPDRDPDRVITARQAIGTDCRLFVDANGAYTVTQAIELAHCFAQQGVIWFEEPVSSDNLIGLDQIRRRAPLGMDIAAGEYSLRASTATPHGTSARCSRRKPSQFFKQTALVAAESAAFSMPPHSAGHITCHSHPTAGPACIFTYVARCPALSTWSIFMTMRASNVSSSMDSASRATGRWRQISLVRAWDWN